MQSEPYTENMSQSEPLVILDHSTITTRGSFLLSCLVSSTQIIDLSGPTLGAMALQSDCAVFNRSNLKAALEAGSIGFPPDEHLPQDDEPMPYFLMGDDAFPLRTWLVKPFSTRNLVEAERLSNYRRIVENAFGILANRFRCLLTTMLQKPETVGVITSSCICLHNLMHIRYPGLQNALLDREDDNHQFVPGAWRDECVFEDVRNGTGPNEATREAKRKRIYYKHYVNNIGVVPWQRNMI